MVIEVDVDGQIVEFPDGTAQDVMQNALRRQFPVSSAGEQFTQPRVGQSERPAEQENFFERFGSDLEKRGAVFKEIQEATQAGEQSTGEGIFQTVGKVGFGSVLDFLGEAVVSAGRGLSVITPDFIEDPIKDAAKDAGIAFLSTDIGKAGLKAVGEGIESYGEFARENPRAARNIESLVDIALVLSPVKAKPTTTTGVTKIGKAGEAILKKGGAQSVKLKSDFVTELVMPKRTAAVATEQVGRTTEQGLLRSKVVEPSRGEGAIAVEVNKLPVTPKRSLQVNYNVIANEVSKEASKLERSLSKNDIAFPREEFKSRLTGVVDELGQNPLITGDAQKTAEKVMNKMFQLVDGNKSSAAGLLKARKELDTWIKSQKGKGAFDPAREGALSVAVRDIRRATNDFIDNKAVNVGVKASLRKQSSLFGALDNIAPKAALEANNAVLRQWQNVTKILPLRGEFNQSMAVLFGVGGLGASAIFAPFFTKLAAGALGTYAAGKFIASPGVKKTIGQLLKFIDEAIRITKDKDLIKQMRLDRATILELLKLIGDQKTSDVPPPRKANAIASISNEDTEFLRNGLNEPQASNQTGNTPDQAAIDRLKSEPSLAGFFDEAFGQGSAQAVLGA